MSSPSLPATRPSSQLRQFPRSFALLVSCSRSEALERIANANGVTLVDRMPRVDAPRTAMLARRVGEGLELLKAPPPVRTPGDDLAGPLQHVVARITVADIPGGTEVRVAFGWRPARTGYLTLWPLVVLLATLGPAYGLPAVAVVLAGFVLVHWPREQRERRAALVAKLSDALGPVLVDGERNEPYR